MMLSIYDVVPRFGSKIDRLMCAFSAKAWARTGPMPAGDPSLSMDGAGIGGMAFAEDKAMIEAQQRVTDRTERPKVMSTAHHRGRTILGRLVETLARQEAREPSKAA